MLPNKKYLSGVPCPDNEEGECWRPYCHFFHKFKSKTSTETCPRRSEAAHHHNVWQVGSHTAAITAASSTLESDLPSMSSEICKPIAHESQGKFFAADDKDDGIGQTLSSKAESKHCPIASEDLNADCDDTTEDKLEIDEAAGSDEDLSASLSNEKESTLCMPNDVVESINKSGKMCVKDERSGQSDPYKVEECEHTTKNNVLVKEVEGADTSALSETLLQSGVLQKLVSDAVKKFISETPLLANVEPSVLLGKINTTAIADSIAARSEGPNSSSEKSSGSTTGDVHKKRRLYLRPPGIPDYKPTPISELNRRKSVEKCHVGRSKHQGLDQPTSECVAREAEEDTDITDFSSVDEDQDRENNTDFDMLEEVMAEKSISNSVSYKTKEIRKRKKALGNINKHAISTDSSCKSNMKATETIEQNLDLYSKQEIETKKSRNDKSELVCNKDSINENSSESKENFLKPHILVPAMSQVTRKMWTPGPCKLTKPQEKSTTDMIEAVLEVLDGRGTLLTNLDEGNTVSGTVLKKADLSKEIESLTKCLPDEGSSSKSLPDPNGNSVQSEEEIKQSILSEKGKEAKIEEKQSKDSSVSANLPQECFDQNSEKISEQAANHLSDNDSNQLQSSDSSQQQRKRSRSHDRSSSREYRRRKRRKRESKHKHSRSKKKKKRRSYSSDFDSEAESDHTSNEGDIRAENPALKIKEEKDSTDDQNCDLKSNIQKEDKSVDKESDDSSQHSHSRKSRGSRKRKRSKHKHKNKRKYKKRRYRSSTSSDSESSSDRGGRNKKRCLRAAIKQEEEVFIDLTVVKDESGSDVQEPPIVPLSATILQERAKSVKTEKDEDKNSNNLTLNQIKVEDAVKDKVIHLDTTHENLISSSIKGENIGTVLHKDNTTKQLDSFSSAKTKPHEERSSKDSRTSSVDSARCSDTDDGTVHESPLHDNMFPPAADESPLHEGFSTLNDKSSDASSNTVYSSKKTLTEISIFDSLLDGSKSSSIKTIKKKCVEQLSSSSLTPSLSDDEEILKKVTTNTTSRTTTTSSHRSSSSSRSSLHSKSSSRKASSSSSSRTSHSKPSNSSFKPSGSSKPSSSSKPFTSSSKSSSSKSNNSTKSSGSSKHSTKDGKMNSDCKGSSNTSSYKSSRKKSSTNESTDRHKLSRSNSKDQCSSDKSSHRHTTNSSSNVNSEKFPKPDRRNSQTDSQEETSNSSAKRKGSVSSKSFKTPSSQESDGISDREPFFFNGGLSHDSSDDNGSPLPDLSALDAVPDEDWDQLVTATPLDDDSATDAAEDECLKLYNEFQQPVAPPPSQHRKRASASPAAGHDTEAAPVSSITRVARPGATGNLLRKPSIADAPPYRRKTPEQVMMERYAKLHSDCAEVRQVLDARKALQLKHQGDSRTAVKAGVAAPAAFALGVPKQGNIKKPRIGAVSNASPLLDVSKALKCRLQESRSSTKPSPSSTSRYRRDDRSLANTSACASMPTVATAGAKGVTRIAHVPKVDVLARPVIASEFGAKVPQSIRQRYLNSFVDEALKFSESSTEAFRIAVSEEKVCYNRAASRAVYLSLAVNTTKRLRGGTVSDQAKEVMEKLEPSAVQSPTVDASIGARVTPAVNPHHRVQSHFTNMAGGGQKGSWSIEKSLKADINSKMESLKGAKLYQFVQRYLLTTEQLDANGYPQPHPDVKGKALVKVDSRKRVSPSPTERYCARCGMLFLVDKWGFPKTIASCAYHWGRPNKRRGACGWQSLYSCCQGDTESEGCCVASTHVSDNYSPDNLTGFVRTLPKSPDSTGDYGVYALDCEMCYTTAGNELTRITVVGHDNDIVYETFVQPDNDILDYNTRFSGISESDLEDISTTLRDVQAALLGRFSAATVLVGHSLESDLMALKLIHNTVVDTSVVFPHKMGPPYKRALRNLAADHLKKIIQNDVGGHDSAEDAITCMELLHWKIKEDLKTALA